MAKKSRVLKNPPSASSSHQEEKEITPQPQTPKSPPTKKSQSSTKAPSHPESSSEKETDSDTEPVAAAVAGSVSKKRSAVAKSTPASSPPPTLTKRPRQSTDENVKSSKRGKVAEDSSKKPGDAKKGRLWSEEDESALLNGIIRFEEERGTKFNKDLSGFFSFIEGSLNSKVELQQMKNKLRKLKDRFLKSKVKDGAAPKFATAHEQDFFDLSMKIWGSDGMGGLAESSGVKKSRTPKKSSSTDVGGVNKSDVDIVLGVEAKDREQGTSQVEVERTLGVKENVQEAATGKTDSLQRNFNSCKGAENVEKMVLNGLGMLQGEKKTELEDKWMEYHVDRLELYLKHLDLLKEQALLILEKFKSSKV